MKKIILNFYNKTESKKWWYLFVIYLFPGAFMVSIGDIPFGDIYILIASINILLIVPFLTTLLIFIPLLLKKYGYFAYLHILFLMPNLYIIILIFHTWITYISAFLGIVLGIYIKSLINPIKKSLKAS